VRVRARHAWPAALGAYAVARYATDSLAHRRESRKGYALRGEPLDVASEDFLAACEALSGAPISRGNEVELLINGDEIFPCLLETLRGAERSIDLLTYVYWQGEIAQEIAGALCERAAAGVEVNVLLDWVGSAKMDTSLVDRMSDAGATVCRFRPLRPWTWRRLGNRTHRKVAVVDGRVGLIGGVGIADEWTGNAEDPGHWRDTHVRVRGPVVRSLQGAFAENWLEATGDVLVGDDYLPHLDPVTPDGPPMQVVRSAAGVGDTDAEALYFLALASAKRTIELTAAYFAPRPAFSAALAEAAGRGVDVRVLVPGPHIDKEFVRVAGRRTYGELLSAGVRVFEYAPTMLHAKTLVVDGAWSSVGSVNFDNRSFQLNDEATLCVQDPAFAERLHAQFERDLERSDEIEPERWSGRPLTHRLREQATQLARREI
jgi:cardiolipin synthase